VTWQDAERAAARYLTQRGFHDARVTRPGIDAGIDVTGRLIDAQVKHWMKPVGRPEVQRFLGAARPGVAKAFFSHHG
jgi:HJR/Mrr/RecB family endonuclease